MKNIIHILVIILLFLFLSPINKAQNNTVGLIMNDSSASFNGYTLFSPLSSKDTYLIDNKGYLVHSWSSAYRPGQAVMLLPDGSLLRTANVNNSVFNAGGSGGRVEKYDWDGNLTWSYNYSFEDSCSHHDIEYMPNGDILMVAWEKKSSNEAVAAGRNPVNLSSDLWSEKVIEVKPTGTSGGTIVWEWHVWDHLIQDYDSTKSNFGNVSEHPELIDLNFGSANEDWLHINSIRYNPQIDEILLSVHNFSEIWIIDHSTTTAQAAGHSGGKKSYGGDIIYRWGNPRAYRAGTTADQKLYSQHDARWIDTGLPGAGDILIFNNGQGRPGGNYSSVVEITAHINADSGYYLNSFGEYGPDTLTWSYTAQPQSSFYAPNISGADRLPNGNTLICEGPTGTFFEIDSTGKTVWEYINPVTNNGILSQGEVPTANPVFKIYRYSPQYSGLAGKDLSEKGTIESYPEGIKYDNTKPSKFILEQNYPNPFNPSTSIEYAIGCKQYVSLKIYDILGRKVATLVNEEKPAGEYEVEFSADHLPSGIYFYQLRYGSYISTKKMMILK